MVRDNRDRDNDSSVAHEVPNTCFNIKTSDANDATSLESFEKLEFLNYNEDFSERFYWFVVNRHATSATRGLTI